MALTEKQKMFVKEYLVDLNATQAAIRAGYSQDTAKEIGYENLTKPHIQKEIQKAMNERTEQIDITVDYILKGVKDIADSRDEKTNDRLKAFELLGKYKKIWTDKVEEKSDQTITIKLEGEAKEWSR